MGVGCVDQLPWSGWQSQSAHRRNQDLQPARWGVGPSSHLRCWAISHLGGKHGSKRIRTIPGPKQLLKSVQVQWIRTSRSKHLNLCALFISFTACHLMLTTSTSTIHVSNLRISRLQSVVYYTDIFSAYMNKTLAANQAHWFRAMVCCCHSENVAALAALATLTALATLAMLAALAALIGTAFKSAVFSKAALVIPLVVAPLTATFLKAPLLDSAVLIALTALAALQALQPLHTFHPLRWGKSVEVVNAIHAVVGIPTAALHVAVAAVTAIAAVAAVAAVTRLFTAPVSAVATVIAIDSPQPQLVGVVVTTGATWSRFSWWRKGSSGTSNETMRLNPWVIVLSMWIHFSHLYGSAENPSTVCVLLLRRPDVALTKVFARTFTLRRWVHVYMHAYYFFCWKIALHKGLCAHWLETSKMHCDMSRNIGW